MGQRSKNVVTRDAPTKHRREESVVGMGQSVEQKHAATKDAPIKSRREEYVGSMVQRSKNAVMTVAQTIPRRMEYAKSRQSKVKTYVVMRDAPPVPEKEESV